MRSIECKECKPPSRGLNRGKCNSGCDCACHLKAMDPEREQAIRRFRSDRFSTELLDEIDLLRNLMSRVYNEITDGCGDFKYYGCTEKTRHHCEYGNKKDGDTIGVFCQAHQLMSDMKKYLKAKR